MDADEPIDPTALPPATRLRAARWRQLWLRGDATALEPPVVAIVGTRSPDVHGLELARWFAWELSGAGVNVISGGALGIDAAVHRTVLEAGGKTAVVLPCGLDAPYPPQHRGLFAQVLRTGGALVSPFPPLSPPTRWAFPRRNALLAALCDVLLVVQAPRGSGTLLAAQYARRAGRRVMVVPAAPGDPRGAGNLRLLREGASHATEPAEVLAALAAPDGPLLPVSAPPAARPAVRRPRRTGEPDGIPLEKMKDEIVPAPPEAAWSLDEPARLVYAALGPVGVHLDDLVAGVNLPAARVRASLLQLTLVGAVIDHADGRYSRA